MSRRNSPSPAWRSRIWLSLNRTKSSSHSSITLRARNPLIRRAEKILLPQTLRRVCLTRPGGNIETPFAWQDAVLHLTHDSLRTAPAPRVLVSCLHNEIDP